jgi:hypothetical protein
MPAHEWAGLIGIGNTGELNGFRVYKNGAALLAKLANTIAVTRLAVIATCNI